MGSLFYLNFVKELSVPCLTMRSHQDSYIPTPRAPLVFGSHCSFCSHFSARLLVFSCVFFFSVFVGLSCLFSLLFWLPVGLSVPLQVFSDPPIGFVVPSWQTLLLLVSLNLSSYIYQTSALCLVRNTQLFSQSFSRFCQFSFRIQC